MMPAHTDETTAASVLTGWATQGWIRVRAAGWRGVVVTAFGGAIGVLIALSLPRQYTSSASFVAQGSNTSTLPSALLGIAASVGIGGARDYSPQFYADLLTSDPVLQSATSRTFVVSEADTTVRRTYAEIEELKGKTPAQVADAALRHLRRRVSARADVRTNIVFVSATARYPELSRDLTRALLDALDSMNIGFRREQSRELRQFFEQRVTDAQHQLDSAETVLRHFLERNRVIANSPLLTFEQMRLTRAADLKRAVYTTVLQQYEEARLQEARNVPVLTILAHPLVPVRKSGPPRRFIVVIGLVLGLFTALTLNEIGVVRQRTGAMR